MLLSIFKALFSKAFFRELFSDLRESLAGSERDFTKIPLSKSAARELRELLGF